MADSASIKVGQIDGYSWIRINGRGDVFLAPSVKKFTDKILGQKQSTNRNPAKFVIDMEDCTGMDSTFMGMMAGLAIKLQGVSNSCLQLCGVNSQNQESLEELGIASLVEINPTASEWCDSCDKVRSELRNWSPDGQAKPDPKLILDTHKTLGSLNDQNKKAFSDVIETFEDQL